MKKIIIGLISLSIILNIYIIMGQLKYPLDSTDKEIIKQVVKDYLPEIFYDVAYKNVFGWQTFFESLDGFEHTAGVTLPTVGNQIALTTTGVLNNTQEIKKNATWQGMFTFWQPNMFRSSFNLNSVADVTAYITIGNVVGGAKGYGFKVVNDKLYGVVHDGTTEKTLFIQTITTDNYGIKAIYTPNQKVSFYVNLDEKGSIISNLPTPTKTVETVLMDIYVKETSTDAKILQTSLFSVYQSRPDAK